MDNLNKNSYCLVALDKITDYKEEVISVSMGSPKFLETKGIFICTFESFLESNELGEVFDSKKGRTYFLFKTTKDVEFKLANKEWDTHLFSEVREKNDAQPDTIETLFGQMMFNPFIPKKEMGKTDKMLNFLKKLKDGEMVDMIEEEEIDEPKEGYSKEELQSFNKEKRDEVMNELLSKGDKLTEEDKELLSFLANN